MPDFFEDVARKWKSFSTGRASRKSSRIDETAVKTAYARWAPVYDWVFGYVFDSGRRAAVAFLNELPPSHLLECGVGTGISLPHYKTDHRITGIDLSPDMLDVARERVRKDRLTNIVALEEADAGDLSAADASFDASVAMFVLTVVPDPQAVMSELARVTKPGGAVVLVSHFADQKGWRKWFGEKMAPLSSSLGWHMDFSVDRILGRSDLRLVDRRRIGPIGFFTLLVFERV
ncbi:class I SAM-dependent methyltransferase [Kaistia dalseonensis]|uniref:Phosphatidylethanolamine/phosphatidyl-N-methylethanolamine N-methyltransferase n=1 Tax=Kaistia dalseonensis TaxID=410840 RepID=A0ABU0H7Z6_9HYPH|nr:class I SAM-dependent methyltransferase [Kaistia dalseonensis]MCX5495424.1 class I SAM-dependent methyltransferase [Kaistia dalseonensis]MDQ0438013.1 phosphatidylethanolamine/phosphatidyl-N-methylethanolamine N-methyltransferase [Kaistia dalseonensis]